MKTAVVLAISPRLRDVLPPLTVEQRERLEANILADGRITDPLCYWHDGSENLIVDGMNRFEIAEIHGIPYDVREMTFPNIDAVELWMLERQAGKRNLTPQQLSEVRGRYYERIKASKADNLPNAETPKGKICPLGETQGKPPIPAKSTAEVVAEQFDVSPRTVKSDAARVRIIDNLEEGVKKSLGKTVHDAAMADLQKLAKLDLGAQETVARTVRTGQAKTLKDALKSAPAVKSDAKPKPPVKALEGREAEAFDARRSLDGIHKTIGQWFVRIDEIRNAFPNKFGDDVLEYLKAAYELMKKWEKSVK